MLKNKRTFPVGGSIAPGNSPLQGRLHAMSPKDSRSKIEKRTLPKVTFDAKAFKAQRASLKSLAGPSAMTFNPVVPSIDDLAIALENDVDKIYQFVANNTGFINTFGSQKGHLTTLIDHYGNSFDQSALMVALLRSAGYTADFVFGQLKLTVEQATDWLGTIDIWAARNLLGNGGIPVDVTWDPVNFVYHLILSHCWVKVDVTGSGNWYVFDPAFKSHTFSAGIDLATVTGFDATTFEAGSMSGATVTADYFKDVNTAAINSQVQTLNDNLISWINTNKPDATLQDLIGAKTIVPVTTVVRNASLPYEDTSVVPTIWTDIPNAYKATLQVQFDTIDETFYSEDISSKNLTLFFNGSLEAELRLDGTLLATSTAQGVGTWNSALLTVEHPYAYTWANQSFWQRVWAGDYYLIAHSWGNSTPDMAFMHQQFLNDNIQAGLTDEDPGVIGESLAVLWHNWSAQKSIMCSMIGQMSGCVSVLHHQLGMVGHGEAPFTDLGGIAWSTSALDNDYSKVAVTDTVIAMRGIGFESGTLNQVPGTTAVSSNNVISEANSLGQKLFVGTSANWSTVRPQLTNYDSGDLDNLKAWYIDGGWSLLMHEDGLTAHNDYSGYGIYAISPWGGCVGLINGMLLGGGGDRPMSVPENNAAASVNQLPTDNLDRVEIGTKVENAVDFNTDQKTGRSIYRHVDISVGNGNGKLELIRTYNSRDSAIVSEVGRGWRHNFMISCQVQNQAYSSIFDVNNPQPPAGQSAGLSASGAVVFAIIQLFLAPAANNPAAFVIGSISTTEASKLLTNNVVIIRDGDRSYTFTALKDGTFAPPKGVPVLLTKITDHYVMQTFEGVRYTFTNWALNTTRVSKIEWAPFGSGRTMDFTYGGVGPEFYLSSISTNFGRSMSFTYNLIGGLVPYLNTATAGAGASSSYAFETTLTGNLISCTDQQGFGTTYTYDGKRRLTMYARPDYSCSVSYDDQDRVVTQNTPGFWMTFQYGNDFTSVQGGPDGGVFTYFNTDGLPTMITTGGQTTKMSYDGLGRMTSKILPSLDSISYLYDQYNRVSSETHGAGPGGGLTQVNTYSFGGSGGLATWDKWTGHTDERGNGWARTYDTAGNLLSQTGPSIGGTPLTKSWGYDFNNDLTFEADESGIATIYTYAMAGNRSSAVHDAGVGRLNLTTYYGYDGIGNQTSTANPRGYGKTMTYDASKRRLTSVTEFGLFGYVSSIGYDNSGNVTGTAKQYGTVIQQQTTSKTYSTAGYLLTETDPLGFVTSYGYNTLGQRISMTDPEMRTRQYQYDGAGRLIKIIDANNADEETRTYNAAGYLATIKDARNNVTTFTRDGFGRAKLITYPDSSTEAATFDVSGNVLVRTMRNGNTITNTYDIIGRLATKTPQGQAVVTYTYDRANRLLSASTPVVSGDPSSGVFSYAFDTAGRQISETNPQSQVMAYELDENGNATKITYPGGYYVERVFDQLDRLTDIKLNGGASAVTFGYDQLSRRISKNYANGAITTYSYDLGNNLLTMNIAFVGSAANWSYSYNKVHQMLTQYCSDDANYIWKPTAGSALYGTANSLNQYPTIGGLTATYDTLGALATYNGWTYSYNTEQMLTAATMTGVSASFLYDAALRQTQKVVGSAKTKYVYSGSHMMEEWNDVAGTLTTRYVYAGADEPVLQMTSAGVVTYMHHDHHGSVIAQSNASTGAVGNKYKYGPFGESAAALTGTSVGYTGQRYDAELGLYHYKARYFHPGIARFLQPDPVGYKAGMNLYVYVDNDPIVHTDPDGQEKTKVIVQTADHSDLFNPISGPGNIDRNYTKQAAHDAVSAITNAPGMIQSLAKFHSGRQATNSSASKAHPNSAKAGGVQYLYEMIGGPTPPGGVGPVDQKSINIGISGPDKHGKPRLVKRLAEKALELAARNLTATGSRILDKEPDAPGSRGRIQILEHDTIKEGRLNGYHPGNTVNH